MQMATPEAPNLHDLVIWYQKGRPVNSSAYRRQFRSSTPGGSGPRLTSNEFPNNRAYLVSKLLALIVSFLPHGMTVAAIEPKIINYRCRSQKNNYRKQCPHFARLAL